MTNRPKFVYVTYIRATPEKVWRAFTEPETTKKFWMGMHIQTDWKTGAPWKLLFDDGDLADAGEILEFTPPRKLVLRWTNEWKPEMKAEGPSICTIELEQAGSAVKLTVIHEMESGTESKFIEAVSGGWPAILSNLKSLLEGGDASVTWEYCKS
jgi:uncharacterized protein YndB with AHSA1/START domain